MKKYSHDYSKVAEAERQLYTATRLMSIECYIAALDRINEVRGILQTYLAQDNMVEDRNVYDGWCKSTEVEKVLGHELEWN